MKEILPQLVLWESQTGKQRWSVTISLGEMELGALASVAFSPDGMLVASGHDIGLALWDVGTGALLRTFKGCIGGANAIAFGDGGLLASASLSEEGAVRLWDTSTGRLVRELPGHREGALAVAFEPDGKHLISGGHDKLVRRWNAESGAEVGKSGKHAQSILAIAIAPTGLIATGSWSKAIKIWSEHGREKHLIEGLEGDPCSLAFSSDSKVLACSVGYRIRRWGTEAADPLPDLRGHRAMVSGVSCSKQGTLLASVAEDGSARLWNVFSGSMVRELTGLRSRAACVAISPDETLVVAGGAGKNLGRR